MDRLTINTGIPNYFSPFGEIVPWYDFNFLQNDFGLPISPIDEDVISMLNTTSFDTPMLNTTSFDMLMDSTLDGTYLNNRDFLNSPSNCFNFSQSVSTPLPYTIKYNQPDSQIPTPLPSSPSTKKSPSPVSPTTNLRNRSDNWSNSETQLFLTLLLQQKTKFRLIRKHPEVWDLLVKELAKLGIFRTKQNCKNRWKVLVNKYKALPSQPNHQFQYTDMIEQLLATRAPQGMQLQMQTFKWAP